MPRIRIPAVLLGIGMGFVAGIAWSIVTAIAVVASEAEWTPGANPLLANPMLVLLSLVGTVGSAFVAGWFAARLAPAAEVAHAVVVGVLLVLLSALLFYPLGMDNFPLWYNLPAFVLTLPAAWMGGVLQRRRVGLRGLRRPG